MTWQTLDLHIDADGITTLALNRPDKHNALNERMLTELADAFAQLATASNVLVLVLTGRGKSFCAGGDLAWFRQSVNDTNIGRITRSNALASVLETLFHFPKPVICRVNGNAFGGGAGLVAASDIAIGVQGTQFAVGETRIGLIPGSVAPYVIQRTGPAKARAIMLSGARFDACQAERIGFLDETVPSVAALDARVQSVARDHLAAAPRAMAMTKQMIHRIAESPLRDGANWVSGRIADSWDTGEAVERLDALIQRTRGPGD